jgi:CRP-like cAMP-binding protein/Fe-S-cluster-containing hydrogenase component 2
MEFTQYSLQENSQLFKELLEVDDRGFRSAFQRLLRESRAWLLLPGVPWEDLSPSERTSAYAVLVGSVQLTREGEEAPSTIAAGQVFGQWTGLRRQPLPEQVTAPELALIMECDQEFLHVALDRVVSRFKEEFYRPLVLASPLFQEVKPEEISGTERKPGPIRQARFGYHPEGSVIVREGEFGNTMFFILRGRTRVGSSEVYLEEGQYFGELAAYTFQPRTATVVATEPTLVMECDRLVVNDLKKRLPRLKEEIDASYRERAFVGQVSKFEFLKSVEPEALDFLKRTATLEDYEPYEPIFFQGDPADALYLVQNGNLNVTQETETGPVAIAHLRPGDIVGEGALLPGVGTPGVRRRTRPADRQPDPPEGALESELAERPGGGDDRSSPASARPAAPAPDSESLPTGRRGQTVTAVQNVNVVRIPKKAFDEMMAAFPRVAERLEQTLQQRRTENMALGENARFRSALQWVMDTQLTPGNHVLAIDMASCIRCGNCVTACEETHEDGLSRFFWDRLRGNDELLPQIQISSSCKHCEDALCMRVCPTVAIERDLKTGSVWIDYVKCIKCGKCADPSQGCPYDSIHIVPTAEVTGRQGAHAERSEVGLATGRERQDLLPRLLSRLVALSPRRTPYSPSAPLRGGTTPSPSGAKEAAGEARTERGKKYPVKCDLCQGKPYEACVHHCPTGAVFRFDGQQHLDAQLEGLQRTGKGRAPEPWPLYLHAAFSSPTLPVKKPVVLKLTLTDQAIGIPIPFRRPEAGVKEALVNIFLTAPELNVGGGQMRQLRLPLPPKTITEECQMTAPTPGARTLRLSVYQGGLYLKTVPVAVEFA